MATIRNFALFHTSFKWFKKLSYTIGSESWKLGNGCYNRVADPNNLRDDDYTFFFYCHPVEFIEFLIQLPAFREHMSYTAAKEINEADEHIHSKVTLSDWWCNEVVY